MIFHQYPNHGDAFTVDGSRLEFTGKVPHTTRDGRDMFLATWSAPCAQCRTAFNFRSTLDISKRRKRCESCVSKNPKWNKKLQARINREEDKPKPLDSERSERAVLHVLDGNPSRHWSGRGNRPADWIGFAALKKLGLSGGDNERALQKVIVNMIADGRIVMDLKFNNMRNITKTLRINRDRADMALKTFSWDNEE